MKILFILVSLIIGIQTVTLAGESMKGIVISVHDGDTFKVKIDCNDCPPMFRVWSIRVLGIDTPELRSKQYKDLADKARRRTLALCPIDSPVLLMDVKFDKYGERLDADVHCLGGNLKDILIQEGLAKVYTGVGPKPWVEDE